MESTRWIILYHMGYADLICGLVNGIGKLKLNIYTNTHNDEIIARM